MSDISEPEVLAEFRAAGALLTGHFILTSGLHSPFYLQCARVLMDPARAGRLVSALVPRVAPWPPTWSSPRLWVGSSWGTRLRANWDALPLRRAGGGQLHAPARVRDPCGQPYPGRRGCDHHRAVDAGVHCLCRAAGGEVVAVACLVDRSAGKAELGVPLHCLATLDLPTYPQHKLPPELAAIPAIKPGSRGLDARPG